MQSKILGSLVATAFAGIVVAAPAMAYEKKKEEGKTAVAGSHCVSNNCGGQVKLADDKPAKNSCAGKKVEGATKEQCEAGSKGTWVVDPAAAADPKK